MHRFLIVLIFVPLFANAAIGFSDAAYPELATSGRALAMGNAFIAKVDDSMSSFYNPAGLGTVRQPRLYLSNLSLETNRDWFKIGTSGSVTDAFGNFAKAFGLDGQRELLLNNTGRVATNRFQFVPNFTARYISMGFLLSQRTRATIGSEVGAQFEYAKRLDYGPYSSINLSLFGGVLKFGVTAIYLRRSEAIGTSDPNVTLNLTDSLYKKGSTFMGIVGTKLTLPWAMLPTIAVTYHNPLGADFGATGPTNVEKQMDVGFSITPQVGNTTRIHFELNYRDLAGAHSSVGTNRKILAGLEVDFFRTIFFRMGYGDGFGSGGFGIRTKRLIFDFTTYAVDTKTNEFRGYEDRRFAITLSSGI